MVCEDVTRNHKSAEAFVLLARLLLRTGDADQAAAAYRQGIDLDPAAADPELAAQLEADDGGQYDDLAKYLKLR
ncbi:MAG: hypothetical protein JWO38_7752 [Gemmataceae bacterium]|nr:hypothetical protein [Gemmataceae bacterium]